jgi:hypothetical protein
MPWFAVKLVGFGRGEGGEENGTGRKVWGGRMAEKWIGDGRQRVTERERERERVGREEREIGAENGNFYFGKFP